MRIAVDTSAIIAAMTNEPDASAYRSALLDSQPLVSASAIIESTIVLAGRDYVDVEMRLTAFLAEVLTEFVPFDEQMTRAAQQAFLRFGKGRHPARLNFGDCMSYALAKARGIPLLYKGGDFALTDIASALEIK